MKNLKELEKKYQELGQEIERLKKSEVQYPIYCLNKHQALIVKFIGLTEGVAVMNFGYMKVGDRSKNFVEHTNTEKWEQLEVCTKTGFFDGQLVWCWDDGYTHQRILRFYDAKNKATFTHNGEKDGSPFYNYEPYEGNWPEWAQEAFKILKR